VTQPTDGAVGFCFLPPPIGLKPAPPETAVNSSGHFRVDEYAPPMRAAVANLGGRATGFFYAAPAFAPQKPA
jgi:hypothetical protein